MKKLAIIFAAIAVLVSCTKSLELNTYEIYVYSLDEHLITSNGTNVSFSSRNPFVASVNETTGTVTALHVGETYIDVVSDQGSALLKVVVKPLYREITDPYLKWGATKQEVKDAVNKDVFEESSTMITYLYGNANEGDTHVVTMYLFDKNNSLESVCIGTNNSHMLTTIKYLSERYMYYIEEDNVYFFGDSLNVEDASTTVVFMKMSNVWCAIYQPVTL